MPNVNLIEEEGGEGEMQTVAVPARRSGGGGGSKVLLILIIVVVIGGAVFALNKFGIVKLWGKKQQPAITQIQEPIVDDPTYAEVDSALMMEDTLGVSFVETPPLTQPEYESSLVTGSGRGITSSRPVTSTRSDALAGMTGNYTIQVSAWRDRTVAEKYVSRLEQSGYPAFVEERGFKDGNWYTVRIGRYSSLKEAKKAVDSFAYELKRNYWIDKVRSN
ncbi:MAG: SPOR domain-containing protein [Bacteroidota bacterium]